jgi:Uncharacterized protein conserved in bacteria
MRLFRFFINLFQFNRTNWRAVALCFLAAMIFWLFNAFNKSYSTNIRFPLKFEYDEDRYVQAAQLPGTININVSGNGWDLFRKHFGIKVPELVIPLDRPLDVKKIVASTLPPMLASQLGALQINFVVTDTLRLVIDERDVHKFKVVVDESAIRFDKGMGRVSPVVILPDTISIEGPKRLLHALTDSVVVKLNDDKITNNFREEIEVKIDHVEFLKRNPPLVEVMFEIGPVVEVEKRIRFVMLNNSRARVPMQPDSVKVLFKIPAIRTADFEVSVKEIEAFVDTTKPFMEVEKVLPTLRGLPGYAEIIKVDSVVLKKF